MNTTERSPTAERIGRFKHNRSLYISAESKLKGSQFKPRESDIFIVTFPKCGTTWMQQIVHQLKTGGDMSFDEITDVVPWIELAYDVQCDLDREQKFPRCYKTHLQYSDCSKGSKYIVIYREPRCALYSLYSYFQGWLIKTPDEITIEEFVYDYAFQPNIVHNYFEHFMTWWMHRNDENVLFLFYEEMKENLEKTVRAVAKFMGTNDEKKIKTAVKLSTFEFMKENSTKFNENIARYHRNLSACTFLDGLKTSDKVVTGSTTKALRILPSQLQDDICKKWKETVGNISGYDNYNDLRIDFRRLKPLTQSFEKLTA
ncbi:amine sulfotransferase-like [Xenia sp. Carnegie-2017]|uniref:amine sulfotransferase-like n=1 Tax=Xenia sp. Carnegie-2017 TaxID=2897299 RepID=UPI001F04E2EA|nr:amine sulfotransferase-like [Xenia sp. Carnegie-2017]